MAPRDKFYIGRVEISDLDKAVSDNTTDKGTEALLQAEIPEIQT